jgi:hypothetical protein
MWRNIVIRAILHCAREQGVALPLLWFHPHNAPAVGHLSHDSDGNDLALAEHLLHALATVSVRSTWCIILPGYAPETIGKIRDAGHELALHFDTMSANTEWSEGAFHEQWRLLTALFGSAPVSNKNHYLRWEGDTDFFDWCYRHKIQLDQSKGASKTGEAGYNFGTCHPYFPIDFQGRVLDVLELPTPTQDLSIFAPNTLFAPLLRATLQHYGVLHLLFHPAHIAKGGVAEAMQHAVREGERAGMLWKTAAELNAWERGRRTAQWQEVSLSSQESAFTLSSRSRLEGATLLWLQTGEATLVLDGEALPTQSTVERWGFPFAFCITDFEPDVPQKFQKIGK